MAKYIEREAAYKVLTDYYHHSTELQHGALLEALYRFPAADVAPVKHGRWGRDNDCSECGCQPWFERDIHTLNYCPNCGAKMDGGVDDA